MATGALFDKLLQWELIYNARFANLGATTTIIPLVDQGIARIDTTTIATKVANASGSSQTFTWSTAPSGLATPFKLEQEPNAVNFTTARLHGPAGIPGVVLNGSSESGSVPDADYWTRAAAAFSIIVCCIATNTAADKWLLSKWGAAGTTEWTLLISSAEKVQLFLKDDSAGIDVNRVSDAAVSLGVPLHICVTKGTGNGATAMNDAVIYVNGSAVASTATNNGSFVDMENLAGKVRVGASDVPDSYFPGSIYCGPFGPTFVQAQLAAAQVKNDYDLWRAAMGLG